MNELPQGVAGLLVAAIFAAAQSTLSSSMNSIATAYVTDFQRRLCPGRSDRSYLRMARVVSAAVGIVGTGVALVMARTDIRSVYAIFLELLGLLGGTLSGLFMLGVFSRRASSAGALGGALASAAAVFSLRWYYPLGVYAYAPTGATTCISIGWLISLMYPAKQRNLDGLTIHSLQRGTK